MPETQLKPTQGRQCGDQIRQKLSISSDSHRGTVDTLRHTAAVTNGVGVGGSEIDTANFLFFYSGYGTRA